MANNNKTRFDILYKDFEYKGVKESFFYDIPFDIFMEGVRTYFDNQLITLDGTDNDIWNAFVDLECLDNIYEAMEDWFKDRCRDLAYEEFKEMVEEEELASKWDELEG